MVAPPLNESELRFLRALLRRRVRFMVVGLSAAALQGAPVVTQGVDLWFEDLNDPGIRDAPREVGAAYVPPSMLNPPTFAGGEVEVFDIVLTLSKSPPVGPDVRLTSTRNSELGTRNSVRASRRLLRLFKQPLRY